MGYERTADLCVTSFYFTLLYLLYNLYITLWPCIILFHSCSKVSVNWICIYWWIEWNSCYCVNWDILWQLFITTEFLYFFLLFRKISIGAEDYFFWWIKQNVLCRILHLSQYSWFFTAMLYDVLGSSCGLNEQIRNWISKQMFWGKYYVRNSVRKWIECSARAV